MTGWHPEQDLTALLDGLSEELLAARDHDLATWVREAGEPVEDIAEPMRRLLAAADAGGIPPHMSMDLKAGVRASIARNQ
jgi:hypothetical protein